ncbi:MAG: hypothetical protein LBP62_04725 [Clostridiales bacterium]|jgi:hypothetical protein|nr:hypothetical protein [Clostridiales bacterium]
MKKVILVAAVVILSVILASCAPESVESLLRREWDDYLNDSLTYDVYDASDASEDGKYSAAPIGQMTLEMRYYSNSPLNTLGHGVIEGFTGNYTTFKMEADVKKDGGTVKVGIESEAVFSDGSGLKPLRSYKKVTENGVAVYEIAAVYGGKNYEYTLKNADGVKKGEIKLSGTYFDNEMIFALVRSCPLESKGTGLNFPFKVPSVLDDASKLTAMRVVSAAGNKVTYQRKSAGKGEEPLTDGDYITREDALRFAYVSAVNPTDGLEMYYLKTGDFKAGGEETYIPVRMKQNGLEYVFCNPS